MLLILFFFLNVFLCVFYLYSIITWFFPISRCTMDTKRPGRDLCPSCGLDVIVLALCQELRGTRTAEGLIEGWTVAFGRSDFAEMSQAVVQQRHELMGQLMWDMPQPLTNRFWGAGGRIRRKPQKQGHGADKLERRFLEPSTLSFILPNKFFLSGWHCCTRCWTRWWGL